jgi:predicted branched-subunit amino acid permease
MSAFINIEFINIMCNALFVVIVLADVRKKSITTMIYGMSMMIASNVYVAAGPQLAFIVMLVGLLASVSRSLLQPDTDTIIRAR